MGHVSSHHSGGSGGVSAAWSPRYRGLVFIKYSNPITCTAVLIGTSVILFDLLYNDYDNSNNSTQHECFLTLTEFKEEVSQTRTRFTFNDKKDEMRIVSFHRYYMFRKTRHTICKFFNALRTQ